MQIQLHENQGQNRWLWVFCEKGGKKAKEFCVSVLLLLLLFLFIYLPDLRLIKACNSFWFSHNKTWTAHLLNEGKLIQSYKSVVYLLCDCFLCVFTMIIVEVLSQIALQTSIMTTECKYGSLLIIPTELLIQRQVWTNLWITVMLTVTTSRI